jgi:hypothetical protein
LQRQTYNRSHQHCHCRHGDQRRHYAREHQCGEDGEDEKEK